MSTNMSIHTSANNEELAEASNMAQSTTIARTKVTSHPVFKYLVTLQLDLSSCYDEMLEYLRATGRFNEPYGLTREGFSMESLDEHGKRDGEFYTEYGLNPVTSYY